MAISKGTIKSGGSIVFPRTSIDNIVKSTDSSTTYVASNGKISAAYLTSANGTASGIVYNADTFRLTITNGGLAINAQTNIGSAYTASDTARVPTTEAVKNFVKSSNIIPQSAVNGLSSAITSLGSKQDEMTAGFGMVISGGTQVALARTRPITTVPAASTTVTIEPGEAYIIDATTTSKTLNMGTVSAGHFGLESHLELMVANEGYIHAGENVTLDDPLEPDAVNNCLVRFHNGHAIISVEDHVQAYMVNNTGTLITDGSLYYGLVNHKYIGFRSELNDNSVPTGGATASQIRHIVGNGMDVGPTITGNLIVKSGATIRDVKLSGVTVTSGNAKLTNAQCTGNVVAATGGTVTFADASIASGAIVSVSGGKLAIEKVTGNGGTVNLGYTAHSISGTASMYASGINLISGGSPGTNTGAFTVISGGMMTCVDCTISGCSANAFVAINEAKGSVELTGCTVSGNAGAGTLAKYVIAMTQSTLTISGCTFDLNQDIAFTAGATPVNSITLAGSNVMKNAIYPRSASHYGFVSISSGAVLDFTNNANAVVINPGTSGHVIVDGGCTVINSAGASVHINGGTYSKINKDGTTA